MTKMDRESEEFGRKILKPLRSVAPLHPEVTAEEKAKFLLHGEKLRNGVMPSQPGGKLNDLGDKLNPLQRRFSAPILKVLLVIFIALILVGGSSFTVSAAQNSLPGEPLYNIKSWTEDLRMSMASSPQAKLDLTLKYTNRRLGEINSLVSQGHPLPDQASSRYQLELDNALQLVVQLDDQQMQYALGQIKQMAVDQGVSVQELLANLPNQDSPAIIHLQLRLQEQVDLSTFGENNPQAFRKQIQEKAHNRHGPKHTPASDQFETNPDLTAETPMPNQGNDKNGNGKNQATDVSSDDKPGNGQGQSTPGSGKHQPTSTVIP